MEQKQHIDYLPIEQYEIDLKTLNPDDSYANLIKISKLATYAHDFLNTEDITRKIDTEIEESPTYLHVLENEIKALEDAIQEGFITKQLSWYYDLIGKIEILKIILLGFSEREKDASRDIYKAEKNIEHKAYRPSAEAQDTTKQAA